LKLINEMFQKYIWCFSDFILLVILLTIFYSRTSLGFDIKNLMHKKITPAHDHVQRRPIKIKIVSKVLCLLIGVVKWILKCGEGKLRGRGMGEYFAIVLLKKLVKLCFTSWVGWKELSGFSRRCNCRRRTAWTTLLKWTRSWTASGPCRHCRHQISPRTRTTSASAAKTSNSTWTTYPGASLAWLSLITLCIFLGFLYICSFFTFLHRIIKRLLFQHIC